MTNDLPLQFDPVLFAKQGRRFSGQIAINELPRISEMAARTDGELSVSMTFSTSSQQFPMVKGTIEGSIVQTCQRCLGDASVNINEQFELVLINPEMLEIASREGHELFEYSGQFVSTIEFLEEEILLALPIVAKHEKVEQCDPKAREWLQKSDHEEFAKKRDNPFASLKNLKN